MVKLATARESRAYGPRLSRNRWEYINAGLYVFAAILLAGGSASQLSDRGDAKSGLVVLLIGLAIVAAVNGHDLAAHLAGIDCRLNLVGFDVQLGLVELAVPFVQLLGTALAFVGILLLLIQRERGYSYRLENHAVNLLIAGPVLWVVGSIHNVCQVYERADGHVQFLQKCVQIPLLMGSLLFLVAGIFNRQDIFGVVHHEFNKMVGENWTWLSIFGSLLFLIGGLLNVVKVFNMQQMDGVRLEKLRGGAQERLSREREGQVPLILEDNSRRRRRQEEEEAAKQSRRQLDEEARLQAPVPSTYKDALVGQA